MNPERERSLAFDLATLSDVGSERANNEDCCGSFVAGATSALFAVADGVGGYEGGELASKMAIDITLKTYSESPPSWGPLKRLHRAVQQANIEIYDRAIVVPELRRMATTITAAVIDGGELYAAHVGDTRLYLIRGDRMTQLTKDHTVTGDRLRMGLISAERARTHPDRSTLTRSVGPELIVAVDKISMSLEQGDILLLCTDGLYNVLEEGDIHALIFDVQASTAVKRLIDAANAKGSIDNLTAGILRVTGELPSRETGTGLRGRVRKLFGR
jgi:serine/threonine protein phosphatase PrpC